MRPAQNWVTVYMTEGPNRARDQRILSVLVSFYASRACRSLPQLP